MRHFCVSILNYQIKVVMQPETERLLRISRIQKAEDLWSGLNHLGPEHTTKHSVMWECLGGMYICELVLSWCERMLMLTSTFNKRNELTYLPKSDTLQVEFLIKHSAWFVSQLCYSCVRSQVAMWFGPSSWGKWKASYVTWESDLIQAVKCL